MKANSNSPRKLNNKGFSLVELIVVIAIMGVLMVVLVPNLTRYVDNARKQSDDSMCAEVFRMCETLLIEDLGMFTDGTDAVNTITISNTGGGALAINATATGTFTTNALETALADMLKITDDTAGDSTLEINLSSNARSNMTYTINFTYTGVPYPTASLVDDGWTANP